MAAIKTFMGPSGLTYVSNWFKRMLDHNFELHADRFAHQLLGNVWEVTTANEAVTVVSVQGTAYLADSLLTPTIKGPGVPVSGSTFLAEAISGATITAEENFSPDQFDISAVICVDGTAGNDVTAYIRLWDNSESSYFSVTQRSGTIANFSGPDDMATITLFAAVTADIDDRIEIWLSNDSGTGNLTLCDNTVLEVRGI